MNEMFKTGVLKETYTMCEVCKPFVIGGAQCIR